MRAATHKTTKSEKKRKIKNKQTNKPSVEERFLFVSNEENTSVLWRLRDGRVKRGGGGSDD